MKELHVLVSMALCQGKDCVYCQIAIPKDKPYGEKGTQLIHYRTYDRPEHDYVDPKRKTS